MGKAVSMASKRGTRARQQALVLFGETSDGVREERLTFPYRK